MHQECFLTRLSSCLERLAKVKWCDSCVLFLQEGIVLQILEPKKQGKQRRLRGIRRAFEKNASALEKIEKVRHHFVFE